MNDAAYSGFHTQVHFPNPSDLSLSTPVHTLEPDSTFGGFFDDEFSQAPAAWIPDGSGLQLKAIDADETALSNQSPTIPFVQIHTTDLQQPEKSYRNTFRRRTAEIKSEAELIKSELAEAAAKERLNATPTPPTRNSSCPSVEGKGQVVSDGATVLLRCPNCPFLSICQVRLQEHLNVGNCFQTSEQQRRECPGCRNIFYNNDSLNLHLSLDHQVDQADIMAIRNSGQVSSEKQDQMHTNQRSIDTQNHNQAENNNLPKSRIFIKSVECLREPQKAEYSGKDYPLLMSDSESAGDILDLLEEVVENDETNDKTTPPPPKSSQKISIKSVDVLRQPVLLPFDCQLQNNQLMMDSSLLDVPDVRVGPEEDKSRQPKIYIRKPIVSSSLSMGLNVGVDSTENGLSGAVYTDVYQGDAMLTPTCPISGYEPSLAPLAQMCSDAFSFDSVLNGNGATSAGLDNTRFSALDLDFGVDFVSEATSPTETLNNATSVLPPMEQQPVHLEHFISTNTPSAPKQKIFIKNVDILKAPQRGTLHLRTVDELNLMNRNEVEHLIVPNLEPMTMSMMELPPLQEPPLALETHPNQLPELPPSVNGNWPSEDGYSLGHDIDSWPWIEEALPEAGIALANTTEASDTLQIDSLDEAASNLLVKDFPQLQQNTSEVTPTATEEIEILPLIPVKIPVATTSTLQNTTHNTLPVPPLVRLLPEAANLSEKQGRIYVANNLLPAAVEPPLSGGTSVRGRPYGAKHSGGTAHRRKQPQGSSQVVEGGKCQVEGCMFRFKSPATLDYHGKCHNEAPSEGQSAMICPECKSTEFSNWNCLHTHLWRVHQIDMELYCCQLCSFKTPIYSRLVNTHAKIHSEERNYKCEQCGKGFKNTKQLKNHRRLHRTQGLGMGKQAHNQTSSAIINSVQLHRCGDCGIAFKQRKTLREHLCKERNEQLECPECQHVFGSKSSLRLHLQSHQARKRFHCEECNYEASDHNAFRRHLATHKDRKRYVCPHCDFRAIQSTAFKLHLQKRHPEQELSSIIYKCDQCTFSSINQGLLLVHQAKHEAPNPVQNSVLTSAAPSSQIKVETSMVLAHSSRSAPKASPALGKVGGLQAF
ncbi:uncharacterized protein Dana_GF24895 [Drosophila ananassae]|uniref:C2H2-type domain-containing protein n=1 Tax=Drosophila ananassae TaxID=7217 RepID=B3M6K3_DROAN|nr:uncharacterized protein LOC123257143 [Drosophila ananassae]EDV38653.1 uncharacterized protein Dana_GF24895 [Drosophila ananassae]